MSDTLTCLYPMCGRSYTTSESPSDWFCGPTHQAHWFADRVADPLPDGGRCWLPLHSRFPLGP